MLRRILVGTDFSRPSRDAFRVALRLGGPSAKYRLVHAAARPDLASTHPAGPRALEAAIRGGEEAAARELSDAVAAEAVAHEVETRVTGGPPASALAREATEWRADLVVVGARGISPFAHLLLGSVARSVLRRATTDVLVVRRPPPTAPSDVYGRVGIATDFYDPAVRAAKAALAVVATTGASLRAYHVVDPGIAGSYLHLEPREPGDTHTAKERLESTMGRLLDEYNAKHLEGVAKTRLGHGPPVRELVRLAEEDRLDLLVVGTHGPGAADRWLLGSVAEGIVERSPCDVLVARG